MIPRDVEKAGEETVIFYLWLLEQPGNDERWAEIFALRQFPKIMTDDVALGGATTISQMFDRDPESTNRLCRMAMAKGYKPKPTDFYCMSVANAEGDPQAFLNHGQGRGHLKKVMEERGLHGDGLVTVKKREAESDPYEKPVHKLHPKIVERIRKQRIKSNPELARSNQAELKSNIIETHGS